MATHIQPGSRLQCRKRLQQSIWMDASWSALPLAAEEERESLSEQRRRRATCTRCGRPQKHCLCASLPAQPLSSRGTIIVLQHPAEQKRTLATVPLLALCVQNVHVVRGRRYRQGRSAVLDAAIAAASRSHTPVPLLVLWPGPGAIDVSAVTLPLCSLNYTLVVFDGTWPQCAEMSKLFVPALSPPAQLVRLNIGNDADCRLRTAPAAGLVLTAEAVARACASLELAAGSSAAGDVCDAILAPLRLLVSLQNLHGPPKGVRGA